MKQKKVIYCAPIDKPTNSGQYVMAGMRQIGLDVIGYDYRSNEHYNEDLIRLIKAEKPDYFFTQKGEILSPELIEMIKKLGCITIYWCFDLAMADWYFPIAKAHDFVVTNVEAHAIHLRKQGLPNVKWVHQGFDPDFFGVDGSESVVNGGWYADLAMIGSMGQPIYKTRCDLVMLLRRHGFDIKWWGRRLSREIRNLPYFLGGVHRAWGGGEVYMRDFADVIHHIRIFVGQDADIPYTGRYLSNRIFAVTGCGGFYLGRRTDGIEDAFIIDREVVVFDSDDEMLEKARFYLTHEKARRWIALAGQRRVLMEYTYKNQIEKIFQWVQEHL